MSLPTIPPDLSPAPQPDPNDPTYLGRILRSDWRAGPAVYADHIADGEQIYTAVFPTFGKHAQQTALLMAGGYRWTGRSWTKTIRGTATLSAERQWALALYRALHPTWVPR